MNFVLSLFWGDHVMLPFYIEALLSLAKHYHNLNIQTQINGSQEKTENSNIMMILQRIQSAMNKIRKGKIIINIPTTHILIFVNFIK